MKTVALRFSDNFAPDCGTIAAHEAVIQEKGYVWYGKLGLPLSKKAINYVMENDDPKILLIHSGTINRYWAHVTEIKKVLPEIAGIPQYYRDMRGSFKTWFKVTSIEKAPTNIMSTCRVLSSGVTLSEASKHSMSPFYIIEGEE